MSSSIHWQMVTDVAEKFNGLTPEDGTNALSRNVGK
jgi:hypothetical protein